MAKRHHFSAALGWTLAGVAAGLTAGVLAGEWLGAVSASRAARGCRGRGVPRGSAAEAVARTHAALAADPVLAGLMVRPVGPRAVEVTGWVDDRATRVRAGRVVAGVPDIDAVTNSVLVRGEDDHPRFPDLRLTDQSA